MDDSVPLLATATRPAPGDFVVDFDRKNGVRFRVAVATIVWAVVFSFVVGHVYVAMASGRISNGAFLIVVFLLFGLLRALRRWQRKEFDAQKCTISDRRVVLKTGWLNRSTKFVPLDRIQDVNVSENWLQRMFKIKSIEIQTAGSGHPHRPELRLLAPANAASVRDVIMERRDQLVIGSGGSVDHKATHSDGLSTEVRDLKATMVRIEGLLQTGLQRLAAKDQHVSIAVDDGQHK